MGLFDELGAGVPGGNISKPLMIALGALLAYRAMSPVDRAARPAGLPADNDPPLRRNPARRRARPRSMVG